jgi:YfiH family protein
VGAHAIDVLEVDLGPGVRAGFTTRTGGVSSAPWDSLDLGLHVGDDPDRVLVNRGRVERWVGGRVTFAAQVHGADVLALSGEPGPGEIEVGVADALVAARPGVGLGVLVADCVPVLLADPGAGVVGVAHAGRQGLERGVLEAAVGALTAAGARLEHVRAVVGPAISGAEYEVPAALREQVAAAVPETWATTSWGTPALDLPAGARAVLSRAGVSRVTSVDVCTARDPRFYSHRLATRSGTTTGRFAGVVRSSG